MINVLANALSGTEQRGNASREFHIEVCLIGMGKAIRGSVEELTDDQLVLKEVELSKNGSWLEVDAPPLYIVREAVCAARVLYLDRGA